MPRSRVYFHFVWATQDRQPRLNAEVEARLFGYIKLKCEELVCRPFALNGMPDHCHLIVSIPPSLSLSDFINRIKGASSRFLNDQVFKDELFRWQGEYSVMSLDERTLPAAMRYVRNQKTHHQDGTTDNRFEKFPEPGAEPPH